MSKTRFLQEKRLLLNHSRCIVIVLSKELTTTLVFIRIRLTLSLNITNNKHKQLKNNYLSKKQVINSIKKRLTFFKKQLLNSVYSCINRKK